ncbi:hypothetical protein LHFGNBLO_000315 [Mesorhizobium sp. AR10]|uniref:hypothetical protein n=1 Tax=Mesorhizobium sp. AR10 TaxID=2865839 RepID=UPI00215E128D|nr:hypothetical protein [Mesorhizobium sp. AR10]UVK39004.1 hypothetical protein LHFGNBLO_000315 [Mesorhizobium sp. AR10]
MPAPAAQQLDDRRRDLHLPSGGKEAAASRGSWKKDTEMPPIERVQGPDIKGMRLMREPPIKRRRGWKSTGIDEKIQLKQQFRIILNCNCQL